MERRGLHSQDAHTTPWSWLGPVDDKSSAHVALSKTAHSLKLRWSADVPTSNLGRSSVKKNLLVWSCSGCNQDLRVCARVPAQDNSVRGGAKRGQRNSASWHSFDFGAIRTWQCHPPLPCPSRLARVPFGSRIKTFPCTCALKLIITVSR